MGIPCNHGDALPSSEPLDRVEIHSCLNQSRPEAMAEIVEWKVRRTKDLFEETLSLQRRDLFGHNADIEEFHGGIPGTQDQISEGGEPPRE